MFLFMEFITELLVLIAVLSIGFLYGTDVFFTLVGRKAFAQSSDEGLANVKGNIDEVAEVRMPVFSLVGILSSITLVFWTRFGSLSSILAMITVLGLFIHLGLYFKVARPINTKFRQALRKGIVLPDTRILHNKWESVLLFRALALTLALSCITVVALAH
jgi:hypothetical protein